ncbi:MAG: hypothetical protein M1826_004608 [Phylliscum demangeonii]|nr:MAG: hypothetical protein M1826_004608 [Phylliscum demangeonii]
MAPPLMPLSDAELNMKSPSKSTDESHDSSQPSAPNDRQSVESDAGEQTEPNTPTTMRRSPSKLSPATMRRSPSKPSPTKSVSRTTADDTPLRSGHEGQTTTTTVPSPGRKTALVDEPAEGGGDGDDTLTTMGAGSVADDLDHTAYSTFSIVPDAEMTLLARRSPEKGAAAVAAGGSPARRQGGGYSSDDDDDDDDGDDEAASPRSRGAGYRTGRGPQHDTTDLLIDFTEQFNAAALGAAPYASMAGAGGRTSPVKSQTTSNLAAHFAAARSGSPAKATHGLALGPSTPSRLTHLATLLDFDIPPAPTPRSVPSVSARELESVRSSYLSQISSLKASLSGKEAEVKSLMYAVADAERRVGEAQELVRAERAAKEELQADRDGWERRGTEMEAVMRNAKDEILRSEHEKTELAARLAEVEQRCETAEARAERAEHAERRAAAATAAAASSSSHQAHHHHHHGSSSNDHSKEVEAAVATAVEKMARELHTLYKAKHETKVGALKKSYEARWEKKVRELERRLDESRAELDELRATRGATLTALVPSATATTHPTAASAAPAAAAAAASLRVHDEQAAHITHLAHELRIIQRAHDRLRSDLDRERVEKGDLVAAVEEMLSISAANVIATTTIAATAATATASAADADAATAEVNGLRRPGSRPSSAASSSSTTAASVLPPSAMRPPVHHHHAHSTSSRAALSSATSSASASSAPASAAAPPAPAAHSLLPLGRSTSFGFQGGSSSKSGIMNNIERMGRGRTEQS